MLVYIGPSNLYVVSSQSMFFLLMAIGTVGDLMQNKSSIDNQEDVFFLCAGWPDAAKALASCCYILMGGFKLRQNFTSMSLSSPLLVYDGGRVKTDRNETIGEEAYVSLHDGNPLLAANQDMPIQALKGLFTSSMGAESALDPEVEKDVKALMGDFRLGSE